MWRSKHRSGMSDVHRHQVWSLPRQHVLVFHSWMHNDKEHQFTLRFHWFLCQAASWTYRSALDWRYDEYHHNAGLQWCAAMICHVSWHVLRSTWFQQTCITLSCLFASWPGKSFLSNNGRRLSIQRGEEGSCRVSIFPQEFAVGVPTMKIHFAAALLPYISIPISASRPRVNLSPYLCLTSTSLSPYCCWPGSEDCLGVKFVPGLFSSCVCRMEQEQE